MTILRLVGHVDERHRLTAEVPATVAPGPVEVEVHLSSATGDDADEAWALGVAKEWAEELADARQDIYSLEGGEPVDGSR